MSNRQSTHQSEEPTVTTAEVLEAPAFKITLPGGETHRVVAQDEAAAKRALRAKLEITRLPAGCKVERWEAAEPVVVGVTTEQRAAPDDQPQTAKTPRRKSRLAMARAEDDDATLAALLLSTPTIGDSAWRDRAKGRERQKGEKRDAFIRRVLLGESS